MYERDISGKLFNKRYQPLVSEWGNPPNAGWGPLSQDMREGTQETETSKYLQEKKSYEIP